MDTITTSIRTDAALKREADRLFADLGMNFSTAVNTFLRQAVREQGLPFKPSRNVTNADTRAAMIEADRIATDPNAPSYHSVDDLFEDLDA